MSQTTGDHIALSRSFPVGPWMVTVYVPQLRAGAVNEIRCEWLPDLPHRALSEVEQQAYEAGASSALAEARSGDHVFVCRRSAP